MRIPGQDIWGRNLPAAIHKSPAPTAGVWSSYQERRHPPSSESPSVGSLCGAQERSSGEQFQTSTSHVVGSWYILLNRVPWIMGTSGSWYIREGSGSTCLSGCIMGASGVCRAPHGAGTSYYHLRVETRRPSHCSVTTSSISNRVRVPEYTGLRVVCGNDLVESSSSNRVRVPKYIGLTESCPVDHGDRTPCSY